MKDLDGDGILDLLLSQFSMLTTIPWDVVCIIILETALVATSIMFGPIWLYCFFNYCCNYEKYTYKIIWAFFLPIGLLWDIACYLTLYLQLRKPKIKKKDQNEEDKENYELEQHRMKDQGQTNPAYQPDIFME